MRISDRKINGLNAIVLKLLEAGYEIQMDDPFSLTAIVAPAIPGPANNKYGYLSVRAGLIDRMLTNGHIMRKFVGDRIVSPIRYKITVDGRNTVRKWEDKNGVIEFRP